MLCPKPVFVEEGFPYGQCLRAPNHPGLCDVYNGAPDLDPKEAHYAGHRCRTCGSAELKPFPGPPHDESWKATCLTCGADPA